VSESAVSSLKGEERVSSGHWLGSVHSVPFIALTLMVQWQKEFPVCKKLSTANY